MTLKSAPCCLCLKPINSVHPSCARCGCLFHDEATVKEGLAAGGTLPCACFFEHTDLQPDPHDDRYCRACAEWVREGTPP